MGPCVEAESRRTQFRCPRILLVASGELFLPACRTPEQMRLANGLCRYRELAGEIE